MSKVSDSLGGKGVLWELFSFNPPSLHLYVELCASSPYLSSILISNPGMIDELMDSLVLDKLPKRETLEANLEDLARGAEDLDLILHSFKNAQVLRVGVRDILGKEDIVATCSRAGRHRRSLPAANHAPNIGKLAAKLGEPMIAEGDRAGQPSEFIVLAMGKFGGCEINYHSDLDMVFLYEADGGTFHARRSRRSGETTTNQHFFSELGQRIIKVGQPTWGRTAGCTKSIPGCGRPAKAARWPLRWPSFAATSPKARANFGSGRHCAKPAWCMARRKPRPQRCKPWPSALIIRRGSANMPTKSAACGSGWKKRPSPTI